MNFRFLHSADLHLGSPLQGLAQKDEGLARRLASAGRAAFEGLVAKALEENVAFAVIAGDVFDGAWKDASIGLFFNQQIARLARRRVPTFFLRGNHDADSVLAKSLTWPDDVREFSTRGAETCRIADLRVTLHGRGFARRDVTENFAAAYPEPVAGWFNIGVLHTACGRTAHENYAPCTEADLRLRGYDYWALGHVHAFEIVSRDPWIVYPGNLQGRNIRECGEKGAVIVEVADGRVIEVRRVLTDRVRWAEAVVDVAPCDDEPGLLRAIEAQVRPHAEAAEGRMLIVRVKLAGSTPLHARLLADADLRDKTEAAAQRCGDDVWLESVRLATSPDRRSPGPAGLDLAAALMESAADPERRAEIEALIGIVRARLPGGLAEAGAAAFDIESILADAQALTLGRAELG
jgi:DNA repair protein SbcD/Mre11